jgi:hypothetical protein
MPLAAEHRETEALLKASGVPFMLLRNGWYTENYLAMIPMALKHGFLWAAPVTAGFHPPHAPTMPRGPWPSCPCGTPMVEIGQDVSEQLDIVPMQVRVLRHIRKRYGCPGSMHAPVTAPLPPQPLPKSNASADFLAMEAGELAFEDLQERGPGSLRRNAGTGGKWRRIGPELAGCGISGPLQADVRGDGQSQHRCAQPALCRGPAQQDRDRAFCWNARPPITRRFEEKKTPTVGWRFFSFRQILI